MLRKPGVLAAALVAAAFALSGPVAAQGDPQRDPSTQAAKPAKPSNAPAGKAGRIAPPAKQGLLESIRERLKPARPDRRRPIRCRG